jgi:hypothetical protein
MCHLHPDLARDASGHVNAKCDASLPAHLQHVLCRNLKYLPHHTPATAAAALAAAAGDLAADLRPYLQAFGTGTLGTVRFVVHGSCVVMHTASGVIGTVVCRVPRGGITYTDVALTVARMQGLVCSPLDKDTGRAHLRCQYAWYQDYERVFLHDPHYRQLSCPVSSYTAQLLQQYAMLPSKPQFPVSRNGSVGVAYHLYKAKDVAKQRPIVPCFQHPLRRAYQAAGRALLLLIKRSERLRSFTILSTKDLHHRLSIVKGDVQVAGYDVKNMYTELLHSTSLGALQQFLDFVEHNLHITHVFVRKHGRKCRLSLHGNCSNRRYFKLTLRQIFDLAKLEMTNMAFSCAGQLLLQTVGLAMGGYCSPGMAIIVCMMAVRYVDDVTVVIAKNPAARALLQDLVSHALPPECELECEQPLAASVRMLECTVVALDGGVLVTHHNKNGACLHQEGRQQFRKFVDFTSAHPTSVKEGVILGTFYRILSNTSEGATLASAQQLALSLAELLLLQYPMSVLRRVVQRFCPRSLSGIQQAVWAVCAPLLLCMLRVLI